MSPNCKPAIVNNSLLFVDFVSSGHHSVYICHLVRFSDPCYRQLITFLLTRELYENVSSQLTEDETEWFTRRTKILEDDVIWQRICRLVKNEHLARCVYVEKLNVIDGRRSLLVFLFLETFLYQLALSPLPRFNIAGVMFRPTFYYRKKRMIEAGGRKRLLFALKWLIAYICMKRAGMKLIFTLDSLAVEHAKNQWQCPKFKLLPDPIGIELGKQRPKAAQKLTTLLIAGALAPRKGISEVANALAACSEDTKQNVSLVVVGEPEEGCDEYVLANLERVLGMGVNVISEIRWISDKDLNSYIQGADAVLTPYRHFKGSSNIVVKAAYFGTPVISTNEGLLGYLVKEECLGAALEVTNPAALANCIDQLVLTGRVDGFDAVKAKAFAGRANPVEFVNRILDSALPACIRSFTPESVSDALG